MAKFTALMLVALVPCVALASTATGVKKDAVAAGQGTDGVVCKREKTVGSNMAKKVCTTAAQREASREKAQKDVQRLGSCASNDPGTCIGEF